MTDRTAGTESGRTAKGRAMRDRIVQTSAELIFATGARETTLDHVRSTVGASKSQLYHYFGDKDELLSCVIDFQGAWAALIEGGLLRMQANGCLGPLQDPKTLSITILTAVQGGLLLAKLQRSSMPLVTALDEVIWSIEHNSKPPEPRRGPRGNKRRAAAAGSPRPHRSR